VELRRRRRRFRLLSEAHRIGLAYLFDPLLAVHTSLVEPLPHQITAVYGDMLPRQPLRFLLADDPGAGKTIMTGLFAKELRARGDLQRCLIVCPGNLAEQWQDELDRRFHLPFEIMTNDALEAARTGNWFAENPLAICRLDKLSRNEDVQDKLKQTDRDLIVCDEAHKMSATYIRGTATPSGLAVTAEWWEREYAKGVAVSDAEMAGMEIEHHDICPRWNYTIRPRDTYRWK
jgi:superfamily II DNA or RNA helicase